MGLFKRWGEAVLWIGIVVAIAVATKWLLEPKRREGFQAASATPTPFTTAEIAAFTFEKYVENQDRPEVAALVDRVANGLKTETFEVTFPRQLAMYALSKRAGAALLARQDLLTKYDTLSSELATRFQPSESQLAAWAFNPKEESCRIFEEIKEDLKTAVAALRARVLDLSGSAADIGTLKTENIEFQRQFLEKCKTNFTDACKSLAMQDEVVFPLVADYDSVNIRNFEDEITLLETIKVVNAVQNQLGCEGEKAAYSVEKDAGIIDTATLKLRLQELSPYYISPATLGFITKIVLGEEDAATIQEKLDVVKRDMTTVYELTRDLQGTPKTRAAVETELFPPQAAT